MTWIVTVRQRGEKENWMRVEVDDSTAQRIIDAMTDVLKGVSD